MRRQALAAVVLGSSAAVAVGALPARADAPAASVVRNLAPKDGRMALVQPDGRLPILVPIPAGEAASDFGLLEIAPGVGGIRLSPSDVHQFQAAFPQLSLWSAPPREPLLDVSPTWTSVGVFREETEYDGSGVVVGVVDTGIDIRHPQFINADGTTRIAWLLTAGEPRGSHPEIEASLGCSDDSQSACAVYSADEINALLAAGADEFPDDVRDVVGHGTHVTSIAAGNGGPTAYVNMPWVGVAPGATIIAAAPSQGFGFDDLDLLKSTRFVFERADELGVPAVVNLSVGSDFGPHDGTSMLESGLSAMVGDDKPGRAIVVAAGNSGGLFVPNDDGSPLGVHTEAHSFDSTRTRAELVTLSTESGRAALWITFQPGDEVSVGFEGPGGEVLVSPVAPGEEDGYDENGLSAAVVNNVTGQAGINNATNSAVIVWNGSWEGSEFAVLLEGTGDAQMWVVGQDELRDAVFFRRGLKQGTINVPASAPGLLAVGCTINRVSWEPKVGQAVILGALGGSTDPKPDGACYFSSAGPNAYGVPKPEISAPGAFVAAAMGIDAHPEDDPGGMFDGPGCPSGEYCYVVDSNHAIASGSSMSAPHAAGAVALLFEHDPTLTQAQVTDLLQASARRPSGEVPLDFQVGPGVLDLGHALEVLAEEELSFGSASVDASWWVLSSGYLRPDEDWPVWGTVELRLGDGRIASGIEADALDLVVDGAVVTSDITKIHGGLYRFAIAGVSGLGGSTATIELRYEGTRIGEVRELPVAVDNWAGRRDPAATSGGCTCRVDQAPMRRGEPLAPALAILVLAGGLARRRRPSQSA